MHVPTKVTQKRMMSVAGAHTKTDSQRSQQCNPRTQHGLWGYMSYPIEPTQRRYNTYYYYYYYY